METKNRKLEEKQQLRRESCSNFVRLTLISSPWLQYSGICVCICMYLHTYIHTWVIRSGPNTNSRLHNRSRFLYQIFLLPLPRNLLLGEDSAGDYVCMCACVDFDWHTFCPPSPSHSHSLSLISPFLSGAWACLRPPFEVMSADCIFEQLPLINHHQTGDKKDDRTLNRSTMYLYLSVALC